VSRLSLWRCFGREPRHTSRSRRTGQRSSALDPPHVVRRAPPPSFRCCSTTLYGRSWLCGELPPSHLLPLSPLPLPPFTRSSWTKRLITADDYAAVQINLGDVDAATGRYMGTFKTFAISGYLRDKGESDMALTELFTKLNNKH
jgi:small subunit ribosomal protein S21e